MPRKWMVLIAVYFGGVTASINQFKVPPIMELVVEDLNFSISAAGWLMSCFALAGFLFALPAGLMIRTRHLKLLSMAGLGFLTVGGLLGGMATAPTLMLVGRIFEGVGLLSMGMAGPTLISLWFPSAERGLPLGIWTSWMPAGSIIMFNLAHPLVSLGGWRTIWYFVSAMSLVALILVFFFVKIPVISEQEENSVYRNWRDLYSKVFTNKNLWLLTLMFISYNFVLSCYYSWAPVYLKEVFIFSPAKAAFNVSLIHLGIIPTTIIAGWVINKSHNYRYVYLGGFTAFTLILIKAFTLNSAIAVYYMLMLGLFSGFIPAAIFAATPEAIKDKHYMAFATSAIVWGQNIGVLLGPSSVGQLLDLGVSWSGVTYLLIPAALLGLLAAWMTRIHSEMEALSEIRE